MGARERLARFRAEGGALQPQTPQDPAVAPVAPPGAAEARVSRPAPFLVDLLPAAGGIAGGIIGGAGGTVGGFGIGGVPGAIGGSALGTAGGEAIRQNLARAMGYDAPESVGEALGNIGGAAKSGAISGAVGAGGGRLAAMAAKAPILRHIPGAGRVRMMAGDVSQLGARIRGGVRPSAPPTAPAPSAPAGSDRLTKETAGYIRRRAMATMEQAGMPAEAEASRKAISEILGREVKSRTSLSPEDWLQVTDAAMEQVARNAAKKAAEKVAASAARKAEKAIPKSKVVGTIKPKVGSAQSRVQAAPKATPQAPKPKKSPSPRRTPSGPSFEAPGALEGQLRASLTNQPLIQEAERRLGRPLTSDELNTALEFLRQAAGQ